jgi:hypothetical protein
MLAAREIKSTMPWRTVLRITGSAGILWHKSRVP